MCWVSWAVATSKCFVPLISFTEAPGAFLGLMGNARGERDRCRCRHGLRRIAGLRLVSHIRSLGRCKRALLIDHHLRLRAANGFGDQPLHLPLAGRPPHV
jgi:hypothetical protein